MFCRCLLPRVYLHGRVIRHRQPWRWMSFKRDIPISSADPQGRQRGPWRREWDPRLMSDIHRDFEDLGRRLQLLGSQRFGNPSSSTTDSVVQDDTSEAQVTYTDKEWEISLNLPQFSQKDLRVKVEGNNLAISGKHAKKADQFGHVTREFTRQITIPEECDPDSVASSISDEGILSIIARVKGPEPPVIMDERDEREVRDDRHG